MPIYEYECSKCHHQLEIIQKINDPPVLQCPQCSEDGLVRLVSAAGFQLKGQGWYVTDFKNKNTPLKNQSATSDSKGSAASSAASSNTAESATKKTKEEGK